MISITIPWPSSKLNPNRSKGLHWAATTKLRKDARAGAYYAAIAAMKSQNYAFMRDSDIAISITFVQPDRRARDRDNLLASLKSSIDGIADALGINDSQFDPVILRREYGKKPGEVRIQIGGAE